MELLFKRFKQNFPITLAKVGSKQYAEAIILLQFIIWTMEERQAYLCECYLKEKAVYSTYENCRIAFKQIKTTLCLSWSLFIDLTNEVYIQFLSKRKRLRNDQNEEFHTVFY